MIDRRSLMLGAAAFGAAPMLMSGTAEAQAIDMLKIFCPAAPGGGWDQTSRTIEQVLRTTNLVKGVQVTNVPGAGGAVGLPQFLNNWKGQGNSLMVAGMVMVGSLLANKSPLRISQTIPVAGLTGEFEAIVVPAESKFKTLKDFADALKADPSKVPVAGGSAGGTDHRQGTRRIACQGLLCGFCGRWASSGGAAWQPGCGWHFRLRRIQ